VAILAVITRGLNKKMPNRVIREGFLDDENVNSVKEETQLFYVRLFLKADDYGRFDARPEYIKSQCYPVTDKRLSDVSHMLGELQQAKLIYCYEVLGKKYLLILKFRQRLRKMKSKYPEPVDFNEDKYLDCQLTVSCQSGDSNSPPESESESESEKYSLFNEWYSVYPKKQGKADVLKKWHKLSINQCRHISEEIRTALVWQKNLDQWKKDNGQFIPMASTYFSQKRWEDSPPSEQTKKELRPKTQEELWHEERIRKEAERENRDQPGNN
jgi:hypothetical protein